MTRVLSLDIERKLTGKENKRMNNQHSREDWYFLILEAEDITRRTGFGLLALESSRNAKAQGPRNH
jgi:hypothetical protein